MVTHSKHPRENFFRKIFDGLIGSSNKPLKSIKEDEKEGVHQLAEATREEIELALKLYLIKRASEAIDLNSKKLSSLEKFLVGKYRDRILLGDFELGDFELIAPTVSGAKNIFFTIFNENIFLNEGDTERVMVILEAERIRMGNLIQIPNSSYVELGKLEDGVNYMTRSPLNIVLSHLGPNGSNAIAAILIPSKSVFRVRNRGTIRFEFPNGSEFTITGPFIPDLKVDVIKMEQPKDPFRKT